MLNTLQMVFMTDWVLHTDVTESFTEVTRDSNTDSGPNVALFNCLKGCWSAICLTKTRPLQCQHDAL